jgi:hypothetical protein
MVVGSFKGSRANAITLVKGTMVSFTMGLHFFVHHTNLAMLVLSKLSLIIQFEVLLQVIMHFSPIDLKTILNFRNVYAMFLGKKKLFKNVKMRWIDMLFLVKCEMLWNKTYPYYKDVS